MKRTTIATACLVLVLLAGCGSGFTLGEGTVTVLGLAPGQTILCGETEALVQFAGSGFLSEHGLDVIVRWTATEGTPFDEGTSATTETDGTVLSDSLFEAELPDVFGTIPVLVTIVLPGGNEGTSPEVTLEVGGFLGPPDAVNDAYGTIGNVPLTVPAGTGVLFNDEDGECEQREPKGEEEEKTGGGRTGMLTTGTVVSYQQVTDLGGSVVMQPDGSFVYTPPLGVGIPDAPDLLQPTQDTFTYTLEQNGDQDVATVTIDICDIVWFIDDTAPPGGNGQMHRPFNSLTAFMAQQFAGQPDDPEEGDTIFVYRGNSGTTPYDDGIRLKAFQKLIGQGVDLVMCGQTLVTATERPILTNTGIAIGNEIGGPVVSLGDANTVRGLSTDGGFTGIEGFFVSGPTLIEQVDIRDPIDNGIRLEGVSGTFQVGDPDGSTPGDVQITGGGGTGIQIGGGQGTGVLTALTTGGPSVSVVTTDIADFRGNGILCTDANLACRFVVIDDVSTGIVFQTLSPGPDACTLDVIDSNIGVTTNSRFRGIEIQNFGADIDADIGSTAMRCNDTCLFAVAQFGPGITIAWDSNNLETLVTGPVPAVNLQGIEGGITVTSMQDNVIVGNGQGDGILLDACFLDADPSTMVIDPVPGGTLMCGQGTAAVQRIEGTALQLTNNFGALDFGAVTIFQAGGDPAGFVNTGGGLTLTFTPAPVVDHVP